MLQEPVVTIPRKNTCAGSRDPRDPLTSSALVSRRLTKLPLPTFDGQQQLPRLQKSLSAGREEAEAGTREAAAD
jgi:hypothetical protein